MWTRITPNTDNFHAVILKCKNRLRTIVIKDFNNTSMLSSIKNASVDDIK